MKKTKNPSHTHALHALMCVIRHQQTRENSIVAIVDIDFIEKL